MGENLGRRRASSAPLLIGAVALLHFSIAATCGALALLPTPMADQYDWIWRALQPLGPGYLFEPHNNQRVVWSRLLTLVDLEVFSGRATGSLIACLAVALAAATAAAAAAKSAPVRNAPWVVAGLVFMLLTEATLAGDAAWPPFSVYVLAASFAVLAIVLFETGVARSQSWLLAAAFACGIGAGFGNAAGLVVWPVLAAGLVRRRPRSLLAWGVVAAGFAATALQLNGLGVAAGSGPLLRADDPANLAKAAAYVLRFLALPFTRGRAEGPWALALGAAVLAAGVASLLIQPRDRRRTLALSVAQGLVLCGLATAAMAAVARVNELASAAAPLRYAPFASMVHAGVVLAWAPALRALEDAAPRAFVAASVAALAVLLVWQGLAGRSAVRAAALITAANAAFDRGDRSPEVMAQVYPDARHAERVRRELRLRGLLAPPT